MTAFSTSPETEPTAESEPVTQEIMSTTEPEVEPEIEPFPEQESEPEVETTFQEPEPEVEGWPEPGPEWNKAFQEWGTAWPVHVYLISSAYLVLAILALIYIIILCRSMKDRMKNRLTLSLLVMIFLFNFTRGLGLLLDPYSTSGLMTVVGARLLWSFGLPGLTASFSLVMLVLLDTTRMTIGPPRFQKLSTIIIITVLHLVVVYTSDLVVFIKDEAKAMLVLCQALFISYGLLLTTGYCYVGVKIHENCKARRKISDNQTDSIKRLTILCFVAAVTALVICVTHIYSAVSVFGVYSNVLYIDPWSWWSLQTLMRVEELVSSIIVIIIASGSVHDKFKHKLQTLRQCCRLRGTNTKVTPILVVPQSTTQISTIEIINTVEKS
ncbi:hypothetical protein KUTeg_002060 [Tegillarca granosa]|uniref:Proline-rich transmembrane protein 3/4 domain-containing protein n=1 Tax=Tegillarca granosa TaxID=220873 RepID=A0ABQ9FXN4_TEGGR|nr:hypothetical protein KUTeg_002060 [Tegillarca granosa]